MKELERITKDYNKYALEYDEDYDSSIHTQYKQLLFWYLMKDERFLKSFLILNSKKPSFDKGICLIGKIGCGKTMLLSSLRKIRGTKNDMLGRLVSENEIVMKNDYLRYINHHLILDDLGTNIGNFNEYALKMKSLLEERYLSFKRFKYKTNISTNLTIKGEENSIKALYGERLADRIKEMCNIIVVKGESLRG